MSQIVKNGQYQTSTGLVLKTDAETPVWYALANKCTTPADLRKAINNEIEKLPELRGVRYWVQKANKREEFVRSVHVIFKKLAAAERDEGLESPAFFKAFIEAIIDNDDFYWFSPAHFKLAIQRGMHGNYNETAKVYGNKITVRHLVEWCHCFSREWFTGVHTDFENKKLSEDNSEKSMSGTVRDVFKRLDNFSNQ